MIELKDASASLTLKDVVIDGAEYSVAAEKLLRKPILLLRLQVVVPLS